MVSCPGQLIGVTARCCKTHKIPLGGCRDSAPSSGGIGDFDRTRRPGAINGCGATFLAGDGCALDNTATQATGDREGSIGKHVCERGAM